MLDGGVLVREQKSRRSAMSSELVIYVIIYLIPLSHFRVNPNPPNPLVACECKAELERIKKL